MSIAGIEAKKRWNKKYFELHSDSRIITVVSTGFQFPALFDYSYQHNNKDGGNVEQQKRAPHLTFFSEYADAVRERRTELLIGSKTFRVYIVKDDLTEESFQAEAWLL